MSNSNNQTCFLALPSTLSIGVPSVFPRILLYIIVAIVVTLILFFVISRCTNKRFSFSFPTILSFVILVTLFYMILNKNFLPLYSFLVSLISCPPKAFRKAAITLALNDSACLE